MPSTSAAAVCAAPSSCPAPPPGPPRPGGAELDYSALVLSGPDEPGGRRGRLFPGSGTDPVTAEIRILRYCVIHDCGNMINPMIVEGQVHGGVAQGVGGALYERMVYDESGQLLNASFMDFLMPYASEVPHIETDHLETPSPLNPLGIKGAGEAGTIPVTAVIASARLNAVGNDLGTLDELRTIAATVIGGTALAGGAGTIYGAVLGALVMQSLQSGMAMVGVDAPLQSIVVGIVLVFAVWVDIIYRRRTGT